MNRQAPTTRERFPSAFLYAVGAVIFLIVAVVAVVRVMGLNTSFVSTAAALNERILRFEDRVDGSIAVIDASNDGLIDVVAPGTNGFLRGTLRGLARERKRLGSGAETPFVLVARADGRLTLDDPVSKRQIDLKSFGPTNARAFEVFLTKPVSTNLKSAVRQINREEGNSFVFIRHDMTKLVNV
jgi:putative photosynthetic complex assembly protein